MIKKTSLLLTAIMITGLLAACGNENGNPDNTADTGQASVGSLFNNQEDQECLPIKDPVCADLDGEKKTFENACEAGKAGSESWSHGAC